MAVGLCKEPVVQMVEISFKIFENTEAAYEAYPCAEPSASASCRNCSKCQQVRI